MTEKVTLILTSGYLILICILQSEIIFRRELEPEGIIVRSHLFETQDDPVGTIDDLFVSYCLTQFKQLHVCT